MPNTNVRRLRAAAQAATRERYDLGSGGAATGGPMLGAAAMPDEQYGAEPTHPHPAQADVAAGAEPAHADHFGGKYGPPDLDDRTKFVVVRRVPILDQHDHPTKGNIDANRLMLIASNSNRRARFGRPAKVFLGHTKDDARETDQPDLAGFARNFTVGDYEDEHGKRPCLYADHHYYKGDVDRAMQFPHRSVERVRHDTSPDHNWIDAVSLLKTLPDRDLRMLTYAAELPAGSSIERYARNLRYSPEPAMPEPMPPPGAADEPMPPPPADAGAAVPPEADDDGADDLQALRDALSLVAMIFQKNPGIVEQLLGGDESPADGAMADGGPPPAGGAPPMQSPAADVPGAEGPDDGDARPGDPREAEAMADKYGADCGAMPPERRGMAFPSATNTSVPSPSSTARPPKKEQVSMSTERHGAELPAAGMITVERYHADVGRLQAENTRLAQTLQAQGEQLQQANFRLGTIERYARRREIVADLQAMERDGYKVKPDEDAEELIDLDPERYQAQLGRMRERYSRRPTEGTAPVDVDDTDRVAAGANFDDDDVKGLERYCHQHEIALSQANWGIAVERYMADKAAGKLVR